MIPILSASTPAAAPANPMVVFLSILGVAVVVSYVAEYIVQRFGRSPIINWRMILAIVTIAASYLFWIFWSQQVNFAAAALDPANSSFRMSLWLFLAISLLVPLWMCYSAILSVWYDRWLPGISLLVVRVIVCIVMVGGYWWMLRTIFGLLSGVRLGLFD